MITIDNILGTVNNTQDILNNIENRLFTVYKAPNPAFVYVTPNGEKIAVKETQDSFRVFTCSGKNLSTMKGQFLPMQPKEFYDNIIATVHEFGADLDLSTLEFNEFCNSKKIEFSIKMKPFTFINNKNVLDETNLYVTFSTSYDGSKSNVISLYTERVVCTNGMVATKLEGTLKGRNTVNGKQKILSYASELAQIINGANEFSKKMQDLDKINLKKSDIEEFKKQLFGFNKATLLANEKEARANGKSYGILEAFDLAMFKTSLEFKELPKDYFTSEKFNTDFKNFKEKDYVSMSAFEVLQSVTHYTNHIAKVKTKTDISENIRFGSGFKTNNKAQEILFELV
jgi:hypothetical protein